MKEQKNETNELDLEIAKIKASSEKKRGDKIWKLTGLMFITGTSVAVAMGAGTIIYEKKKTSNLAKKDRRL